MTVVAADTILPKGSKMVHTVSIKEERSFRRAYKKGVYSAGKRFSVFAVPNRNRECNRLGIVVSKKAGNSVQRNRIRRLVREYYRLSEMQLKTGYDIVISAREAKRKATTVKNKIKAVSIPDFNDVKKELSYHFHSLDLYLNEDADEERDE